MSSYLHLAKADLKYAQFGLTQGNDEVDVNYAAYHVHQAIEKIAKGLLEFQGEDMARRRYRTHDIGFLLSCLDPDVYIPEIISQRTFEIMRWVSEPRYNVNFRLSSSGVYEIYVDTLEWLHRVIPPVKGAQDATSPLGNYAGEHATSKYSPSEHPVDKSPTAKNYPKRYAPSKDAGGNNTSKKSKYKKKKKKSRA